MKESDIQKKIIDDIRHRLPEADVLKNDARYKPGYPDLSIHYKDKFALLETKRASNSSKRPNQDYYISKAKQNGAFASFINFDNKDAVLDEMERALKS